MTETPRHSLESPRRVPVRHIEMLGHVSNDYPRTRMAECGHYFAVHEFAPHVGAVTCQECLAVLDARDAVEV